MTKNSGKPITFRATEDIARRLAQVAESTGRTQSHIIKECIEYHLEKLSQIIQKPDKFKNTNNGRNRAKPGDWWGPYRLGKDGWWYLTAKI